MDKLLELKEQLKNIYGKHTWVIDRAFRFVMSLLVFVTINLNVGFIKVLSNIWIAVLLSAICAFLPLNVTGLLGAALLLAQLSAVSIEIMIVMAGLMLIMFVFYFRFTPKSAKVLLLMPVSFMLHMPFAIPMCMGLAGTPIGIIPVGCGVVLYYSLHYVKVYSSTIANSQSSEMFGKITFLIQNIFHNKNMLLMLVTIILMLLVVYIVRRMSINYAWIIAVLISVIVGLLALLIGDFALDIQNNLGMILVEMFVSVLVAWVVQFFLLTLDYSRAEKVQFEDDEYYYYVKAIPKVTVAKSEKHVKRIQPQNHYEEPRESKIITAPTEKELGATQKLPNIEDVQSEQYKRTAQKPENKIDLEDDLSEHKIQEMLEEWLKEETVLPSHMEEKENNDFDMDDDWDDFEKEESEKSYDLGLEEEPDDESEDWKDLKEKDSDDDLEDWDEFGEELEKWKNFKKENSKDESESETDDGEEPEKENSKDDSEQWEELEEENNEAASADWDDSEEESSEEDSAEWDDSKGDYFENEADEWGNSDEVNSDDGFGKWEEYSDDELDEWKDLGEEKSGDDSAEWEDKEKERSEEWKDLEEGNPEDDLENWEELEEENDGWGDFEDGYESSQSEYSSPEEEKRAKIIKESIKELNIGKKDN